jgi:hypothetical protein
MNLTRYAFSTAVLVRVLLILQNPINPVLGSILFQFLKAIDIYLTSPNIIRLAPSSFIISNIFWLTILGRTMVASTLSCLAEYATAKQVLIPAAVTK